MADAEIKNDFDDEDDSFLFDSPSQPKSKLPDTKEEPKPRPAESRFSTDEAREAALKQELENVRKINQVVEGVVESLEKAKSNMDVSAVNRSIGQLVNWSILYSRKTNSWNQTVSRTVNSASTLLQSWTRILSQTEHNQRLILNPQWRGATNDLAEIENDVLRRQQEAIRRHAEDEQRREAASRKAQEEERKRAATAARGSRGARVGSRVTARPGSAASGSASTAGYGRVGGPGTRGASRGTRSSSTPGRSRGTRGRGVG
jgi:hypothetical protein